jgi:UDP-2,3-diacylglucosamine hydrolase
MEKQWFISDLHLATERPATLALFEHFLADYPQPGERLFILGDLFDVWIGDDDDAEIATRVRNAIRAVADRGIEVLIQRGNRDLIMGKRLMRECGAERLSDCYVTCVAGHPTLLMHGDLLCTDDVDYQKTRRRFRNPLFQWLMLRKSLHERRRIVAKYRRHSREATARKPAGIMDVNDETVVRYLTKHRVRHLIHGHTHRPASHKHRLPDDSVATRLVLPEWHEDHAVAWVDDGNRLDRVDIKPDRPRSADRSDRAGSEHRTPTESRG